MGNETFRKEAYAGVHKPGVVVMDRYLAKMVIYKDFERDSVLMQLGKVCREFRSGSYEKEELVECIYEQVHKILDIATQFGFDENPVA